MNGEDSLIATPDGIRATCRYWTPEWRAMIHGLRDLGVPVGTVFLTGAGVWGLTVYAPGLVAGAFAVACCAVAGLAYALSYGLNHALAETGGGYGLAPRGNASFIVEFTRTELRITRKRRTETFRSGAHAIFLEPHKKRTEEMRHEQRSGRPTRPVYRDAFQVWLKDGLRLIELAAIADEDGARSVVRLLQEADCRVSSGVRASFQVQAVPD